MLTQGQSGRALTIAKAKAKNIEFGRQKKDWPNFGLTGIESDELSYDTVLALSLICEDIINGIENDEQAKDLTIVAQYFDAATKTGDRPQYDWDFLLSGAVAYFINNDFGGALALISQIEISQIKGIIAIQVFCFLHYILKGGNIFQRYQADSDLLIRIRNHYNIGEEHPPVEEVLEWKRAIRETNSIYDNYYIDLLLALIKIAEKNSAWILLPQFAENEKVKWESYLRRGDTPRILWSAQKLIGENGVYKGKDCIIQLPTGTGKTKSIELIIKSAFIEERAKNIIVLAPLRALCFEISRDLQYHFKNEAKISRLSDSLVQDELLADFGIETNEKNIIICTPEKLNYVMRHKPEILESIDIYIFDEGHMFDDDSRGVEYELLLTTIKVKAREGVQKIFISAVLPNINQVNEWLFQSNAEVASSSIIKTTEKNKGFLSGDTAYQIRFFTNEIDVSRPDAYLPRIIEQTQLRLLGNERNPRKFPDLTKPNEVALYLTFVLCNKGNVAIYVKKPINIKTVIEKLVDLDRRSYDITRLLNGADEEELTRIANLISRHYGESHYLKKGIERGLAGHHSKLENGIKISVEYALRENKISAIVCTSTLAQGVNLPLRYMLVTDITTGNEGKAMKVREFQNLIGRTARSGKHTEGSIIVTNSKLIDKRLERGKGYYDWIEAVKLFDKRYMEDCKSTLGTLFEDFRLDWDGNSISGLMIVRAILENFEGNMIEMTLANFDNELLLTEKQNEFRMSLIRRVRICDSLESYICFRISNDEEEQGSSEENYKAIAKEAIRQTFAYKLCNENEKTILIEIAEKTAIRLFVNRETVIKKFVAHSLVGFNKGKKLSNFLTNHASKIDANISGFLLECINFLDEEAIEELIDEEKSTLISSWLDGLTVQEIAIALGKTSEDSEKLCGYCSYQLSYLLGELADMKSLDGSDDQVKILREQQLKLKYGLSNAKEIRIYENHFHDRFIAKSVAAMIGDEDTFEELRNNKDALALFLNDYPSVFLEKFSEVVDVNG